MTEYEKLKDEYIKTLKELETTIRQYNKVVEQNRALQMELKKCKMKL